MGMRWHLVVVVLAMLAIPAMPASAWKVVIHNPNGYALTDYQVRVDLSGYIGTPTYLKVTDASGKLLPFTYEQPNGECGLNPTTVIWVKVPYIPANGNTVIYVEPSNTNYAVKPDRVFLFYDDFDEGYLNKSKWETHIDSIIVTLPSYINNQYISNNQTQIYISINNSTSNSNSLINNNINISIITINNSEGVESNLSVSLVGVTPQLNIVQDPPQENTFVRCINGYLDINLRYNGSIGGRFICEDARVYSVNTFSLPIVVESKMKMKTNNFGLGILGLINNDTYLVYGFNTTDNIWNQNDYWITALKVDNTWIYDELYDSHWNPGTNWFIIKAIIKQDSGSIWGEYNTYNNEKIVYGKYINSIYYKNIHIGIIDWNPYYHNNYNDGSLIDWIRVRKYADIEPTVTIEAAAPQPTSTPTPYYPPPQPTYNPPQPSNYQPPVAVISPHTVRVYQGQTITLSALSSYDPNPNGRIVIYQWTDENGNILSNSPVLRCTLPVGTHTITLRATDNYGLSSTDTATVEVLQKQTGMPAIVVSQSSLNPANGLLVVSVVNTGDAPAYDVRVMERIPSGIVVSYVEGATSSGGLVIWSGNLQPSQEHTIRHSIKMMTSQAVIPVTVKYKDPKGVEHEIMTTLFINSTAKHERKSSGLPISEQTLIVLVAIIVVGIVAVVVAMRRKPPKIEFRE